MHPDVFQEIARLRRTRQPAALATVIATKGSTPAKVPARMLILPDGTQRGTVGGGCIEAEVIRAARDVLDTGIPRTLHFRLSGEEAERTGIACGGMVDIMVESLEEPWVVVVGAGHVGQAVSGLASGAGFRVLVVDDRPDFANQERFPQAAEVVVTDFDRLAETVKIGPHSYVLVMTRGHSEDLRVLQWALTTPARYIGVLGSRSKRVRFLQELEAHGFRRQELDAIHMPLGLDVGAETVPEIAISIVAELIKVRRAAGRPHA